MSEFQFLTEISIFDRNFNFCPKLLIFDRNLNCYNNSEISDIRNCYFDRYFNFCPFFIDFIENLNVCANFFIFLPKLQFLSDFYFIFDQNLNFVRNFVFWSKINFWRSILNPRLIFAKCAHGQVVNSVVVNISNIFQNRAVPRPMRAGHIISWVFEYISTVV